MGELIADNSISPFTAILWCFYPMAVLVLIELILRAINNDDDDNSVPINEPIVTEQNLPSPGLPVIFASLFIAIIVYRRE